MSIDLRDRTVLVDEQPVQLSATEYRLLCELAAEPTSVFTRDQLLRSVWGLVGGHTRTLDSHACRLRSKRSSDTHRLMINVWGVATRSLTANCIPGTRPPVTRGDLCHLRVLQCYF